MKEIKIENTKEIIAGAGLNITGALLEGAAKLVTSVSNSYIGLFDTISSTVVSMFVMASNPAKAEFKFGNNLIKVDNTKKIDYQIEKLKYDSMQSRYPVLELGSGKSVQKIAIPNNFGDYSVDSIAQYSFDDQGIF
ncbi:hypothetical protein NX779_03290 [Mycoplasma cottewii]|uniref:Uncharacterized protein n=1 Tax=Mycoplasma cottewii TaxID=51364 RepID=A0ABY5TVX8_9MOLU|nr:hypothetical protein [Mycoplasma cottewii]UWD34812.1 hypothetical protein NX779_03290 [Mycoplasma cottewii]